MERFKDQMQKEALLLAENPGSALLTKAKFDLIVQYLKNPTINDANFKHWIKKKKFALMNKLGIGLIDVLVVPNEKAKDAGSASFLRVLHSDNVISVLHEIHADELKHSGYKKVLDYVQRQYQGPTRNLVQKFCSTCPTCQLSAPQISRPPLNPMVEKDFLERVQIDLIDMRHCPDGNYHYIAYFMDHFSKYHVLFPLETKSAIEVAKLLEQQVLAYFGPPKIFHSDNGREFVNQVMRSLFQSWGGQVTFVNGRPRHSQSQGLVERGNRTVEAKLAAMKVDEGCGSSDTYPWASWLPRIMFSLNTEVQRTTNEPPYKVVFGKAPPTGLFPGATSIVEEEDMEEHHVPITPQRPIPAPRRRHLQEAETEPVIHSQEMHLQETETEPESELFQEAETEPVIHPQETHLQETETEPETEPFQEAVTEPDDESRHTVVRKRAFRKTVMAAERMEHFYNKKKRIKIATFSVGDIVSVGVPKLDRASTDMKRVPAMIVQVHGIKRLSYTLATEHGRLKTNFLAGDLEKFSGTMIPDLKQEITLREAAKRQNPENIFTKGYCDCATGCNSMRCSCRSKNITCSTHCHSSTTCHNKDEPKDLGTSGPKLSQDDKLQLATPSAFLNDHHINAAQIILQQQFPAANGLQDTLLQQNSSFKVQSGPFVQIIHTENHWIKVARDDKTIKIYDSLRNVPDKNTIEIISKYVRSDDKQLEFAVMHNQHQGLMPDCGPFAVAFASSLLFGEDPTNLKYDETKIRKHLQQCLETNNFVPFPSRPKLRSVPIISSSTTDIYCACRCPDNGQFMIECESCNVWFHAHCVNVKTNRQRKDAEKSWVCNKCSCASEKH